MQKKLYDIGWSDESECQACHKEEGTEKAQALPFIAQNGTKSDGKVPEAFRKWEQKAETSKKEWKWQRGLVTHPLNESQRNRGHFSMIKWESEKHKKVGVCQQKASMAMLPLTALFWVPLASGVHVVGQWCSWIMMKNWGPCMECTVQWRPSLRSSAPPRGRS